MNARTKGKGGEREVTNIAKHEFGFDAKRTGHHQDHQGHDAADVTIADLPFLHLEVKRTQTFDRRSFQHQAATGAKDGQVPVICHRENHGKWWAMLPMKTLFLMLQCCDLEALEVRLKQTDKNEW